jgi:hypothetical protein
MSITEDEAVEARVTGRLSARRAVCPCPYPGGWPERRYWFQGRDDERRHLTRQRIRKLFGGPAC